MAFGATYGSRARAQVAVNPLIARFKITAPAVTRLARDLVRFWREYIRIITRSTTLRFVSLQYQRVSCHFSHQALSTLSLSRPTRRARVMTQHRPNILTPPARPGMREPPLQAEAYIR